MSATHPTYHVSSTRIEAWAIIALVLVCMDALLTTFALYTVNGAQEINPVYAWLFGHITIGGTMSLKVLAGSVFAMFLAHAAEHGYPFSWMQRNWRLKPVTRGKTARRAYRMLLTLTALHGLVVINNTIVIWRHS